MTTGDSDPVTVCPVDRWRILSGPTYICVDCRDHLVDDLAEIDRRYRALNPTPGAAGLSAFPGAPGFTSRPPGRVDVWVARDPRSQPYAVVDDPDAESDTPVRSIARALATWAQLIVEVRGEIIAAPTSVHNLVNWLIGRVEYVARWPVDGPALALDMRTLRNQLRWQTGEPNAKPAAYCIRFDDVGDGILVECKAAIFLPRGENDLSRVPALYCSGPNRHRYGGTEMLRLKLANDEKDAS